MSEGTWNLASEAMVAPGVKERPLVFESCGESVCGILSLPATGVPQRAVVFTHGWSGHRCGPAGLLTAIARALAFAGCACLRFDFRGRGESEGDGLHATLATMSEDLRAAETALRQETGLPKTTLFGMCSGGNIAIGSLKNLPATEALALLSVYPFSDGDSFGRDVHRVWHFLGVYLHKACSPDTWKRVFRGEASIGRAFGVLLRPFLKRGENRRHEEGDAPAKPTGKTAKASAHESRLDAGKEPPKKYLTGLRKDLPALMIDGTGDPDAPAALQYFGSYVKEHSLPIRFEEIPGANHNYSSAAWRKQVLDFVVPFCTQKELKA